MRKVRRVDRYGYSIPDNQLSLFDSVANRLTERVWQSYMYARSHHNLPKYEFKSIQEKAG